MSKAKRFQLGAFASMFIGFVAMLLMQRTVDDFWSYVAIASGVVTIVFAAIALKIARNGARDNG